MAERRINRRSQAMQIKKRDKPPPAITEEGESSHRIEKSVISTKKDATVEVTVKVKKRRDKPMDSNVKFIPLQEREYRKGSWGDLLASSRTSLNPKDEECDRDPNHRKESLKEVPKTNFKKDVSKWSRKSNDNDHSPLCQKIPITDDLYLETHTHFRKPHSSDHFDENRSLLKQNEELRKEVCRLRKEVEVSKVRSSTNTKFSSVKITPVSFEVWESDRGKGQKSNNKGTRGTQTSTTSLVSPKKSGTDETDGVVKRKTKSTSTYQNTPQIAAPPVELRQVETMRLQNEELRQQISKLLMDINQTRSENCEFVSTIKELHQTADALTRANRELQEKHNMLILNHHGQQALQDQLLQIVTHNVQMKETLESLMNKQNSPTGIDDSQLAQFRNVIKDVKSTIAQEMQGLAHLSTPTSAFMVDNGNSNSAFVRRDSSLNDTNASEIRRILTSQSPETRRGRNFLEDRSSSTQYLNLDGFTGFDSSRYRPSPLTVSKFSPRISTPNSFSNFSLSLTEVDASALYPPTGNTVSKHAENKWKALEEEVSRTFIPLRNELSNCSTTSYSSSSTSSSPNPMMMK